MPIKQHLVRGDGYNKKSSIALLTRLREAPPAAKPCGWSAAHREKLQTVLGGGGFGRRFLDGGLDVFSQLVGLLPYLTSQISSTFAGFRRKFRGLSVNDFAAFLSPSCSFFFELDQLLSKQIQYPKADVITFPEQERNTAPGCRPFR
jgi:hypothetical protein